VDVAIIGAGPYGLSLAAHLRARGVRLRIFGQPMRGWSMQMPKGMLLKSDGFASNLSDPDGAFTLKRFCAEQGIEYADTGIPVHLDTFITYGLAFQQRMAPDLEDKTVVGLDRSPEGFVLRLDDGEMVAARRAVLATGIGHFRHMPAPLAHLPPAFASHSSCHRDPGAFRHRSVAVIGRRFGHRPCRYTEAPILFHRFPERLRPETPRSGRRMVRVMGQVWSMQRSGTAWCASGFAPLMGPCAKSWSSM
jgi:cation diffusion facilitator CzcD-associated flavoprotein CzcO